MPIPTFPSSKKPRPSTRNWNNPRPQSRKINHPKKREEHATEQEQVRDNTSDRGWGPIAIGGAMPWRLSMSVTPLQCAITKNVLASPLESAPTKLLDLKSPEINTCRKRGGSALLVGSSTARLFRVKNPAGSSLPQGFLAQQTASGFGMTSEAGRCRPKGRRYMCFSARSERTQHGCHTWPAAAGANILRGLCRRPLFRRSGDRGRRNMRLPESYRSSTTPDRSAGHSRLPSHYEP